MAIIALDKIQNVFFITYKVMILILIDSSGKCFAGAAFFENLLIYFHYRKPIKGLFG